MSPWRITSRRNFSSATTPGCFPGNVGGGRQGNAEAETFRAKGRPRIGTYLAQPVDAEGLNGARQENHGDTCDEKNHALHRKPQCRNGTSSVIAIVDFVHARE